MRESAQARARRAEHALAMRSLWAAVMRRDGYRCQADGIVPGSCDGALVAHHRKPRGSGGPDSMENLIVVCGGATGSEGHHGWIHRNRVDARTLGLLISQWAPDPTDVWEPPENHWTGWQTDRTPLPPIDVWR